MPRYSPEARCRECGLRQSRCICSRLPRVRLPWDLRIVQHHAEVHKPSNTGRLLAQVVENSDLLVYAMKERPLGAAPFREVGVHTAVLFPLEGAVELDASRLREWALRPTRLVFLDATWRQARRMCRRAPGIRELEPVCLPAGPPSRWPIRRATSQEQLSTLEAAVRMVELLPELEAGPLLEEAFRRLVEAQVASRPGGQPGRASLERVRSTFDRRGIDEPRS